MSVLREDGSMEESDRFENDREIDCFENDWSLPSAVCHRPNHFGAGRLAEGRVVEGGRRDVLAERPSEKKQKTRQMA